MSYIYGEIAEIININISQEMDENNLPKETYELRIFMQIETDKDCIVYNFGTNLIPKRNISYFKRRLKEMYGYLDNDDIEKLIGQKIAIYGTKDLITRIRNPITNDSIRLGNLRCTYR